MDSRRWTSPIKFDVAAMLTILTMLTILSTDDANDADEAYAGECTCGAKKGNKIVGGEEASVGRITFDYEWCEDRYNEDYEVDWSNRVEMISNLI